MPEGEFSVCTWFSEDPADYEYDIRFVDGETAVKRAVGIVKSVAGQIGWTKRVIITDGGDCIVFEWLKDKGVVFPVDEEGKA